MRIEILNTGTELLLGTTLNSHGAWLGKELSELGLRVQRQVTVPDGDPIRDAIAEAVQRCDMLIVTGGLGPTSDDLTREATAEAMGLELIEDEHALRIIADFFASRNRPMADANRKQALVPCGAEVLPNHHGTSPGIYVPPRLSSGRPCAIFLLPGPPNELHPMYHAEVPHRLRALADICEDQGALMMKFVGVGESEFHDRVDADLHAISGLEVGYCARPGELDLRLMGAKDARYFGGEMVRKIFGEFLVSEDGSSLEANVVWLMQQSGKKLALAESCTGGRVADRITSVPGASDVLTHGWVTYANEAKRDQLGVAQALLDEYGAVSDEVARAMAEGALRVSGADIAVSVTGIAGPSGGSELKPVGTVWISLAHKGGATWSRLYYQPRGRDVFKDVVSQFALDAIRRSLLDRLC